MSKKAIIATISIIGGLGILGLLTWLIGAQFIKTTLVYWRTFSFFFFIIVLATALVVTFGVIASRRYDGGYYSSGTGGAVAPFVVLSVGIGVVALVAITLLAIRVNYDSNRFYINSVEVTDSTEGAAPDFEPRAPYDVAFEGSDANMGSTTGTAQATKSIADGSGDGLWNTLIVRQGFGVGYESVQTVNTPLYGSVQPNNVDFCKFDADKAPLRFGGALIQNNLSRVIDWMLPFDVTYDSGDSYGYCAADGTPYVVIPLKQVNGWYAAYETPYGVLTMNGKTGEFRTIADTDEIAKIPGSTYPMSLAAAQRSALNSTGTLEEALWGNVGYTLSAFEYANSSEFQLVNSDTEKVNYVTPISPRGDSTSIIGITTVDAKSFKSGALNTIDVYLLDPDHSSKAFSTKTQDLKNDYRNLLAFANDDVHIYEIIPGKDGSWVASIGTGQATIYRAVFDADGTTITLYNAAGDEVSKTAINGEPDAPASETGNGEVPTDGNGNIDLSSLTPDQLRELAKQIIDELANRTK